MSHKFQLQDQLVLGVPAAKAVADLASAHGLDRIFLVTSKSVAGSALVQGIQSRLGEGCVGVFAGVTPHSPRECVIDGADEIRKAEANIIVAVGGGSVIDAAKVMQLTIWAGIHKVDDLDNVVGPKGAAVDPAACRLRMIAIPTTLSAAEFTPFAGMTLSATGRKEPFEHPLMVPRFVILDPQALADAPPELVVMTGVRAIDHCVETFCSSEASPYFDALASEGLKLLVHGLSEVASGRATLQTCMNLQTAAWMAISGPAAGVPVGASHAIGRVLGALANVAHGQTSALLLPAVLKWNAAEPIAAARQQKLLQALGGPSASLSDAVRELLTRLGQPKRLSEAGVQRSQLSQVAEYSMPMLEHHSTRGNARKISSPREVEEILELAW
ncbi:iron-containing alcohol dehydrogenase [Hydrocarboniphaga sp.]|uniref:iron-containing alcohol dehydrogenase n=1 Tax=Hydrocarboniphaga sp. TaxID=2033016 RepID=UPI002639257E|nr:iron-containing alcohol dehydrogenase [Hydrocarboniphaga sp.]